DGAPTKPRGRTAVFRRPDDRGDGRGYGVVSSDHKAKLDRGPGLASTGTYACQRQHLRFSGVRCDFLCFLPTILATLSCDAPAVLESHERPQQPREVPAAQFLPVAQQFQNVMPRTQPPLLG